MKKNKEILIATSNNGKIKEFENLLAEYKVVSLKDYDIEDAIEDGTSFFLKQHVETLDMSSCKFADITMPIYACRHIQTYIYLNKINHVSFNANCCKK